MDQTAIVILFILVAVGAFLFYKHTKSTTAHKSNLPTPTTPAPSGTVGVVGGGGGLDGTPSVKQK